MPALRRGGLRPGHAEGRERSAARPPGKPSGRGCGPWASRTASLSRRPPALSPLRRRTDGQCRVQPSLGAHPRAMQPSTPSSEDLSRPAPWSFLTRRVSPCLAGRPVASKSGGVSQVAARPSLRLQGRQRGAPGQDPHLLSAPTLPGTPTPFRRLPSLWTGYNLENAFSVARSG